MMCSACDISDSSIHIFTIVSIAKNALGLECRPFPPLAVYVHDRKLVGAFFSDCKMATTNCLLACHQNFHQGTETSGEHFREKKKTSEEHELELERVVVI